MQTTGQANPYDASRQVIGPPPPMPLPPPPLVPMQGSAQPKKGRTQLTSRRKGTRRLAFFGALLLAVGLGASGFYGYTQWQDAEREVADTKAKLKGAMKRAAKAEKQAMSASAELSRSSSELESSKESLARAKVAAEEKEQAASALEGKLASLLEDGQGQVVKGKDGRLTLQLVDKVLFRSGEAELTKRGKRVIGRVGKALNDMKDKQIWVQGHTDDVPVKEDNELFKSNWELSAARALTVVHHLQEDSGLNPKRLAAAAFGSHRPVSKRQKSKNRRIEIVLFPRDVALRR